MNIKIKNLAERAGATIETRVINSAGALMLKDEHEIGLFADLIRVQLLQELELQRDHITLIDQNDWQRGRDRGIRKSIETVQNFFAEK
jgi:hypothetical protein